MQQDYFAGAAASATIKAPASVTADGYTPGIDLAPYNGAACVLLAIANTAGTSPTMDVKLQSADDANLVGVVTYSGTGNGKLTEVAGSADTIEENITVTFSSATAFAVAGSVTGAIGSGTVGTRFNSSKISLLVFAGSTPFANNDAFTVPMSARSYSDITGAAFTRTTSGGGFQKLKVETDTLGRYLRGALDIGGSNSPAYIVGLSLLALKQNS